MIIVGLGMVLVYYRMFFSNFDYRSIRKYEVVLIQNPEYHGGAVRQSPSWWLKTKHQIFELQNINPVNISDKEIHQIRRGDSLKIFTYEYFSIASFFRGLNGRVTILGLKSNQINKYNPTLIKKHVRELDIQAFWVFHLFMAITSFAFYSDMMKKKYNTDISK